MFYAHRSAATLPSNLIARARRSLMLAGADCLCRTVPAPDGGRMDHQALARQLDRGASRSGDVCGTHSRKGIAVRTGGADSVLALVGPTHVPHEHQKAYTALP